MATIKRQFANAAKNLARRLETDLVARLPDRLIPRGRRNLILCHDILDYAQTALTFADQAEGLHRQLVMTVKIFAPNSNLSLPDIGDIRDRQKHLRDLVTVLQTNIDNVDTRKQHELFWHLRGARGINLEILTSAEETFLKAQTLSERALAHVAEDAAARHDLDKFRNKPQLSAPLALNSG